MRTSTIADACPPWRGRASPGPVLATGYTAELAEIVLRDSAQLLAEDAEQANSHGWSRHHPALPLYTEDDVDRAVGLITPVSPAQAGSAGPHAEVTLHRAGHIGLGMGKPDVSGHRGR